MRHRSKISSSHQLQRPKRQATTTNPFLTKYAWGRSEVIEYKNARGERPLIALWAMIERFNYYRHTRATALTWVRGVGGREREEGSS